MTSTLPISLVISTRNAGGVLEGCIDSCRDWISEIVVVDMESEDDTLAIAERHGAKIVRVPNAGWAEPGRQSGLDAATQPWILVLDADERAGEGMRRVVAETIERDAVDGLRLPRRNEQFGRFEKHSGLWPDWQLRLFRKAKVSWPAVYTHQGAVVDGVVEEAPALEQNAILHESFKTIHDWVVATNRYTDHEAERLTRDGVRPSLRRLVVVPGWHFVFYYFRQGGWRGGRYGLAVALLGAIYRLLGELKLWEKQVLRGERQ